jgi:hypothetical protein
MQDQCTPSPATKRCTTCGETKPLDAFGLSTQRGRQSLCRPCSAAYSRTWAANNAERRSASARKWRAKNVERVRAYRHEYAAAHRDRANELHRQHYAADPDSFKAAIRRWRSAHPEWSKAESDRRWKQANHDRVMASNARWQAANPERRRLSTLAREQVRAAIKRGDLIRPDTCEECGTAGVTIEAAHADYSRPLEVRWLCRPCHRRWDAADPKTLHG